MSDSNYTSGDDYVVEFLGYRFSFNAIDFEQRVNAAAVRLRLVEPAQRLGALILPPDQGAHLMPFGEQHCGEVAADSTDVAGRSGHEDRAVMCRFHRHIAYLVIAFR